jgi:Cytochrome c554 and c-prime
MLKIKHPRRWALLIATVVVSSLALPGPGLYYKYKQGKVCASCHEIWQPYNDWHTSTHRQVACSECHGSVFTLKAGFHINNMRRLFAHVRGVVVDKPQLRTDDVLAVAERCQRCHQQEFASWRSGRHSAMYKDIFLNQKENQKQLLTDDCLRCHGMHFRGPINELVLPINTHGPWRLKRAELSEEPAVPCLSCHRVHREGAPLGQSREGEFSPGPQQEINRPSVALFDRRSLDHIAVSQLPLPEMLEGTRIVKISPDQRQALCYQCHAPRPERQVNSGDDRTPIGVHEGLSCFACHSGHGQQTRASCSTCHPRLSNCGIAVEKMDTTFKNKTSKHDIHFVKCAECHDKGVPKKNRSAA